jgi:integrase/recombinase XerD
MVNSKRSDKTKYLPCNHCGCDCIHKVFIDKTGNQKFHCQGCEERLTKSLIASLDQSRPACPHCECKYVNKVRITKAGSQEYLCSSCKRYFTQRLIDRLKTPNPSCLYCTGNRTVKVGRSSTNNQSYQCRDCRKVFSDSTIQRFSENRPPCPYCENKFAQKIVKDQHGNQKYYCPSCRKVFPRSFPDKIYLSSKLCPFCDSQGVYTSGKTSAKNDRYRCKSCNEQFTDYTYIRLTQIIPPCLKCSSNNYVQKYGLTKDGVQKYKCTDCSTKFTEITILSAKVLKPLCLYCGSSETKQKGYDFQGNPKFFCFQCNKRFIQADNGEFFGSIGRELKPVKPFNFDDDFWDVRSFGFESVAPAKRYYFLNFSAIEQDWFKLAAKNFIKYTLSISAPSHTLVIIHALNQLSSYLRMNYPNIMPSEINRAVLINFLGSLSRYATNTKRGVISSIRKFFDTCRIESWLDISSQDLIRKEDYPKAPKNSPKYIPQEVIQQLNNHLCGLPEPIMRMVLVVQEVGMRVSELCLLPFNCLSFDADGTPWVAYYHYKMKKDHNVPITIALSKVVQEQQEFIREHLEDGFPYLFCGNDNHKKGGEYIARASVIDPSSFSSYLKKLAKEKSICDMAGNIWNFHPHQFRHTVGTNMINNGTPQHIIQRYLGHESPSMTSVYAHIHDQTLSKEFAKFNSRMVNVAGEIVKTENVIIEIADGLEINDIDAQWLKKNIRAQSLPNGLCALPAIEKTCPFGANKCMTCAHFKTDVRHLENHREHLQRTNELIAWATENSGSKRATEIMDINLPVQENLAKIIERLEGMNEK